MDLGRHGSVRDASTKRPAAERMKTSRGGGGMGTGVVARLAGGAAERGDAAPRVIGVHPHVRREADVRAHHHGEDGVPRMGLTLVALVRG